jgi:hypothetical protein
MSARDPSADGSGERAHASAVDVARLPWAFTQQDPLSIGEFIRAAKDRGVDLNELKLRQLYKRGVLAPLVVLTATSRAAPQPVTGPEPATRGTWLTELRAARDDGRLIDLATQPFLPRLPFTRLRDAKRGWWSGLLYSHHQLALIPHLTGYLSQCRYSYCDNRVYPALPEPGAFLTAQAPQYRRIALMATALEVRYLPVIDPDYVHLVNAEFGQGPACDRPAEVIAAEIARAGPGLDEGDGDTPADAGEGLCASLKRSRLQARRPRRRLARRHPRVRPRRRSRYPAAASSEPARPRHLRRIVP